MPTQLANHDQDPVVGIDLGTTFSCVALWDETKNEVVVLKNLIGKPTTPSWVGLNDEGHIVVGERNRQLNIPFVYDAKRMIGKKHGDEVVSELGRSWDFNVVENDKGGCSVEVPGRENIDVEQISSMVLEGMKLTVEKHFGRRFDNLKAVVTVPAYFKADQKEATKAAAKIAGLNVLRMIGEPTSAVMAAGLHEEDEDES